MRLIAVKMFLHIRLLQSHDLFTITNTNNMRTMKNPVVKFCSKVSLSKFQNANALTKINIILSPISKGIFRRDGQSYSFSLFFGLPKIQRFKMVQPANLWAVSLWKCSVEDEAHLGVVICRRTFPSVGRTKCRTKWDYGRCLW